MTRDSGTARDVPFRTANFWRHRESIVPRVRGDRGTITIAFC
jgi:hypothetical protein